MKREEKFNSYDDFVEKFKPKKTTDDCYTPPEVYEVVKNFVIDEYKINDDVEIVRPFYPGGDYENYNYPENCVVIDNPPFSILKKIQVFYVKNNIKFFLFAPHLTLFSSNVEDVCNIVTNSAIKYENGAIISTSFVTNLDKYKIRLMPALKRKIEATQEKRRIFPEYEYPENVISSALLSKYLNLDIDINFTAEEVKFIRALDSQREYKKTIYGSGYLISDEKVKELKVKELKVLGDTVVWELSEREKEIIKGLSNG